MSTSEKHVKTTETLGLSMEQAEMVRRYLQGLKTLGECHKKRRRCISQELTLEQRTDGVRAGFAIQ